MDSGPEVALSKREGGMGQDTLSTPKPTQAPAASALAHRLVKFYTA